MSSEHEITPSGQAPVVAVFGEMLADVFPDRSVLGGAPFNVARHLQVFGLHPVMISRIGNDALGDALQQEMQQRGMDVCGIQRDAVHATGQVKVMLEAGSHHFDILPDQAYDYIDAEPINRVIATVPPRLAYFGTLALRSATSRQAAMSLLQSCHCPVFLDINLRAPWYGKDILVAALQQADIVKLNDDELAVVADMLGFETPDAQAQAVALQQRFALRQVLVTCGAAGSWLLDEHQQLFRAPPAESLQVVDTVGAGDAYAAVFIQGLLQGWEVPTILHRASQYAAAQCRVRGAAPVA